MKAKVYEAVFIILISFVTTCLGYFIGYCRALNQENLTYSPPMDLYANMAPETQPEESTTQPAGTVMMDIEDIEDHLLLVSFGESFQE